MVGGTVIETLITPDMVWINTKNKFDTLAIFVKKTALSCSVSEGDDIWRQGRHAMWTPNDKNGRQIDSKLVDVKLERIGYSGARSVGL